MRYHLELVRLNQEQIKKAKEVNGARKKITHALLCGPYGQIFSTELKCRKYYSAWIGVFPQLFEKGVELENSEIIDFESTFDLVAKLISVQDSLPCDQIKEVRPVGHAKNAKKGLLSWLFGRR